MTIILILFNLLFPILGLFGILLIIFLSKKQPKNLNILLVSLAYSLSIIAFLYTRTNDTGDIVQYANMLNNVDYRLTDIGIYKSDYYSSYYYSWYSLLFIFNLLDLNIKSLSLFCIFIFYISSFFSLKIVHSKINDYTTFKIILFKILTLVSIITLISSYRNPMAFSLVFLGIILIIDNKKLFGTVILIIGIGFHPSSIILVSCYLLSKIIKFKKVYLFFSFSVALLLYSTKINQSGNNFFLEKLFFYTHSEWASFNFNNPLQYFILIGLTLFLTFLISNIINIDRIKIKLAKYQYRNFILSLLNFCLIYALFAICFIFFRTLSDRFLYSSGSIIFIVSSYFVFHTRVLYKKNIPSLLLLSIWFLWIDPQLLYFQQKSYVIGSGFPYNLFYSPVILLTNIF